MVPNEATYYEMPLPQAYVPHVDSKGVQTSVQRNFGSEVTNLSREDPS